MTMRHFLNIMAETQVDVAPPRPTCLTGDGGRKMTASGEATAMQAYDPEEFRRFGHAAVDLLADYLGQAQRGIGPVLPPRTPEAVLERWPAPTERQPLLETLRQALEQSNHLHHPRYLGHQVSAPLPAAALCDLVGSLLNNGTAVFEMGPVTSILERRLVEWMAGLIGYGPEAGGFFTSGGSAGNLTALLAAREAKAGVWESGQTAPSCILVNEHAHYSAKRAVQVMGWGAEGAIPVSTDTRFRLTRSGLEEARATARSLGRRVLAVVANACSTATGTYDPLPVAADFCEQHGLWLHVDGAHGASALLSRQHRHLLEGLARADSVVWDAHKMMMMPALLTAVVFQRGSDSYSAFAQRASYLLAGEAREEWFNLAHRTLECTKTMMALRLYACLRHHGVQVFEEFVDRTHALTREFEELLREAPDFEPGHVPESNILCFRHLPEGYLGDPDALQARLRQALLDEGSFYIVQTRLPAGLHLRCTLMNPRTTRPDLVALLERLRQLAR